MRFAGNTSNVGSWIQAGKAGARGAADAFKAARSNAPDYGGIGEANMKARSMERQAATAAETQVAEAGLKAITDVKTTQKDVESKMKVLDKKLDAKRMAGMVGMFGAVAGGAFLGVENNRAQKRQDERDAAEERRHQEKMALLDKDTSVDVEEVPEPVAAPEPVAPGSSISDDSPETPESPDSSGSPTTPKISGGRVTQQQGYKLLRAQGMDHENATIGAAVMMAESKGITKALNPNGEHSVGLWQHNRDTGEDRHKFYGITDWSQLEDPETNARATYRLWKRQGGWEPWGAFTNGSYKQFL